MSEDIREQAGRRLFDSHCHIIDPRFPIVANNGYTPPPFPLEAYLAQTRPLGVVAGAIVSGSFQANDQTYLMDVLPKLGTGWAGVTQFPNDCPDAEIARRMGEGRAPDPTGRVRPGSVHDKYIRLVSSAHRGCVV